MIEYPLLLPEIPGFRHLTLRMANVVGISASPFTGQQQTYEFPGEWWEAEFSLPPILLRDVAESWESLMAALRGRSGTFLLGDSMGRFPRGATLGAPLIPRSGLISAAGSKTLLINGMTPDIPQNLAYGDYIEIGRNFLSSPSDFTDADWYSPDSIGLSANAGTAPDGSATADEIILGDSESILQDAFPPRTRTGNTYIFRVWLKSASPITLRLALRRLVSASPDVWEEFGSGIVGLTTQWGYFEVESQLDEDASGVQVVIENPAESPPGGNKTFLAWGASLDDNITQRRLHKALLDADSDANGFMTVDIFPRLREQPDEAAPLKFNNTRGTFRLADNLRQFSVNEAKVWSFDFKAIEAI